MRVLFKSLIVLILFPSIQAHALSLPKLHLALITTGGTIASVSSHHGGLVPEAKGSDLLAPIPQLHALAQIDVIPFSQIDSSQMTPQLWAQLSKRIAWLIKDPSIDGVIVTHGTDTMVDTAFFLDLTLHADKPVVLTGAMRGINEEGYDGKANILAAVQYISGLPMAARRGVTIEMNGHIYDPVIVKKINTHCIDAFSSGAHRDLAAVLHGRVVVYHHAIKVPYFKVPDHFPKVRYLITYPGDDGYLLLQAIQSGAKGLVVDGMGAGNVGVKMYQAIHKALAKGIPVVLTTQVPYGGVWPIYGGPGGGARLLREGVFSAKELSGSKARLLLMLALSSQKNVNQLFNLKY